MIKLMRAGETLTITRNAARIWEYQHVAPGQPTRTWGADIPSTPERSDRGMRRVVANSVERGWQIV